MKIIHVGYGHNYDDIRIFQKECRSLAKAGHDVTFITSDKAGFIREQTIEGVKIKVIKLIDKRFVRLKEYQKALLEVLIREDADIYHFHEFVLYPTAKRIMKRGKKVIYDLHEDSPRQLGQNLKQHFGKLIGGIGEHFIEKIEDSVIRKADGTITVVDSIADRLTKAGAQRVQVIANYPIMEMLEKSKGCAERKNKVCYCGGISLIRGIRQMVDAMEGVDGRLILAGPISEKLKNEVSALKGWEKVDYRGTVTKEEVDRIYDESVLGLCLYLVTPNNVNSNPNKLFECMNAGIPVICSDFPIWREIVEEGNCGLCVDAESVEQITEAIVKLLNDRKLSEEMGMNGKKLVSQIYNWGQEEKKLLQLYDEIIGKAQKASVGEQI